ncbi:MAG TPA: Hsp20/alpha crystallin family protein [Opitutus sp.]|nr:Hsp20/alpha crystallin family protein [Opitutus sp.]
MSNQIMQWDPFRELEDMHRHLSTLFDASPFVSRRGGRGKEAIAESDWSPVVDISEDDKAYVIKAELPEVKKEDVHVRVENGVLTLTGERKQEKEEKGRRYHRIERAYGAFARSFTLPGDADPDKVNASYKDGMLTVSVAKAEHARAKPVEVKVA